MHRAISVTVSKKACLISNIVRKMNMKLNPKKMCNNAKGAQPRFCTLKREAHI